MARDYYNEKKKRNEYTPTQSGAKQGADSSTRSQSSSTKKEKILKNLGINNNSKGGSNNNAGSYYGGGYRRNTQTQKQKEVQGPQQKQTTQQRRLQNYERRTQRPRVASTSKEMMQQRDLQNQIRNKANERTKAYQEELNSRRPVLGQIKDNKRISPDVTAKQREIQQRANQQTQSAVEKQKTRKPFLEQAQTYMKEHEDPSDIKQLKQKVKSGLAKKEDYEKLTEYVDEQKRNGSPARKMLGDMAEVTEHTLKQVAAADKRMWEISKRGITDLDAFLYATPEQIEEAHRKNEEVEAKYAADVEHETEEIEKLKKEHGYLGSQALDALSSGVGMAVDLAFGPAALAHMWVRTTGTTKGQVSKKAEQLRKNLEASGNYTEAELDDMFKNVDQLDMLNAMVNGGIEVLTEKMFAGIGLGRRVGGKGFSITQKAADRLFGRLGVKSTSGALGLIGKGVGEEIAEEEIGNPVQAWAANLIYGNKFQEYSEESTRRSLKEYSDNLISQVESPEHAKAIAARLSSDDFIKEGTESYKEAGFSDEESKELSELTRDYLSAALEGDTDAMEASREEMVKIMNAGERSMKESWTLQDAVDVAVSTAMMTAVSGGPGAITTAQTGAEYKATFGNEGVRNLAEIVRDWDSDSSAKAQAMIDHIDSGKELSDTQVAMLIGQAGQLGQENFRDEDSKWQVANKKMKAMDLRVQPMIRDQNGAMVLEQETQQKYDRIVKDAVDAYSGLAKTGQIEGLNEQDVELGADIAASQMTGVITAEQINQLVKPDNEAVRMVFEDTTGIDLSQFEVKKNGKVDVAATNKMIRKGLFAQAADNYVESASIEQEAWNDKARGEMSEYLTKGLGDNGDIAALHALQMVDPRDKHKFQLTGLTAQRVYDYARSTEDSWDQVKNEFRDMFKDVDAVAMKFMYDAAKDDKAKAENKYYGKAVKAKEEMSRHSLKDSEVVVAEGKFANQSAREMKASDIQVLSKAASQLGLNVIMTDNLAPNENGRYLYKSRTIYLNSANTMDENLEAIFSHEVTHHLAIYATDEYLKLSRYVMDRWYKSNPEEYKREIKRIQDLYKNVKGQELSPEEALEELIADGSYAFWSDEEFVENITTDAVASQDTSFIRSVINAIKDILQKIRSILASEDIADEEVREGLFAKIEGYDQALKLWMDAYDTARSMVVHQAIEDLQERVFAEEGEAEARHSITPEMDDKYMRAAKRGDMRTTQQMVDDVAEANGYVKSVYHGTGEYFNVFNLGREGIHLGNKEQASEVSRSRYMLRSKNTNYSTEDVLNNLDRMSPEAIEKVLETVDYASLMLRNSVDQYRGDHSDIESIRAYAKEVTDAYKQEQGKDLGFRLPTFDRKVGENMLRLYAKLNNPFVIEDDIGDWTPARIADVLLLRAEGATEMDGGIERNGTTMLNISGSEISLGRETRKALEKISKYEVKDDEAWRLLRGVLEQKGYDGIQYLNTYEGDRNSYSYIALNPRDVKLADPITYDDNGEIIPLSERFDTTSPDMRYSITPEQDAEYMAKVEEYQRLYDSNEWGWIQAEQELQKMVDKAAIENGYNIKAYHGTDAEPFNVFDRNKLRHGRQYGDGFYFSPYEEVAGQYGSDVREYYLKANGMTLHELFDRPAATGYRDFDNREEALEFSREKRKQFEENGQGIERFRPESRMVDGKYRVTYTTIGSFQNNLILVATDPEYIKSADPITYDDNGNVIPLSERFDATSPDMRYSISEVDSEGNALSEGQREFFKDSKVVDEDGNLLRLYHGTPDYGFTVFDGNGFRNHDGWFFTSSQKAAESYAYGDESGVYAVYLNLKNPMIIDAEGQDWTSISTYKSIEARNRAKEIDARLDEIRDAWVNKTDNGEYNRLLEEFEELDEQMSGGDTDSWVATAKEEGHDGLIILNILDYGANYEGGELVEFTEVIAFERNQIKNIDNLNPTEDEDIRYSVSPEMQQKVEREVGPDIKFSINGSFRDANAKAKFIASLNSGKGGFAGLSEIASGKTILERTMLKNGFDIKQTNAVVGFLEHMAKYLEDENLHLKYRFIGWDDLTDAKVSVRRDSDGNIVSVAVSAMVVNGEYPVNFDMTTICNKREGVMEVIQALTQKYDADTGKTILNSIKLTDEKMWSINKALKAEGIDTACLGCFVEARRYYTNRFIDKIDEVWNSAVRDARKKLGLPEEEYFNFAKGKKVSGEDYNQVADLWTAYDESTESKRSPAQRIKILMDEIVKNKEVDSPYLKLISAEDILTPEGIRGFKELSTHRKDRDMVKMIKSIYGTSAPKEILAFTPYNSEIALLPEKIKGIDTADYLKSIGGTRVQSFSDFKMEHFFDHMQMVAEEAARGFVNHGYSKVIAYPRLFGLTGRKINMSVMFDVLPASEWQNVLGCDPIKAVEIAKKYQGLRFVKEKPSKVVDNRPYKEATIEGVHGYLTYLVSDADYVNSVFDRLYDENIKAGMSPEEARRKANTDKPFEQSINYREAVELQNKEGYKENIGIIAVAFGDEHLKMLLDDPNVRYIIPYHRSGLPVFIAQKTALDIARNYTDFQNTNKAKRGLWISPDGQSRRMKSMYEEFVSNNPSLEYPAIEFFAKEINGKGYTVEFGKKTTKEKGALAGTASFDVYENLETAKDIREISNAYLEYCINHNYVPVFHEFAGHPNYYKMLFDFAVTDGTTDHIYPQRAVKNVYPGLNLEDIVASGRSIEDLTEDDFAEFYEQIEKGFAEQNAKTEIRRNRLGKVLDEDLLSITGENSIVADSNIQHIVNGTPDYTSVRYGNEEVTPEESPEDIKHSISANYDDAYMDAVNSGDMETAQRLVDEAAHIAGMRVVHRYHGSMNANFTRFDKAYAKVGGNSGAGFYFSTSRQDSADHYENVEGADNYFKWSELAELIHEAVSEGTWEGYPELGIEADDIETYEDAEEAAKKILNRSPGVYDVYLNYKNPYVRDYNRSTDLFDYIMDGFDESIIDRDDYDSEDDYEDALIEYRDEYFFDRIYKAVYAAYDQIEGFYDYVDLPNAYDLASTISGLYDYNLNWESIEREIYELHEVVLSRDDWDGSGDGTRELTRAIIEQLGFDAIEDKEVSSKFGQLSREMATDTEHIIVFKPEQIKLSDPVTYREDGSVIPLSERFDPNNDDIRYSLPTQDSDGKVLTDGQMEYFKNSQARDEQGRLVPVYHSTDDGGFTIFDPMMSDDHRSIFFTNSLNMSKSYFDQESYWKSKEGDIFDSYNMSSEPTLGTYAVYLNLENPMTIDGLGHNWNDIPFMGSPTKIRNASMSLTPEWDMTEDGDPLVSGHILEVSWEQQNEDGTWESRDISKTFENPDPEDLGWFPDEDVEDYVVSQGMSRSYFNEMRRNAGEEPMDGSVSYESDDAEEEVIIYDTDYTTREIAELAYSQGYDGAIIRNVKDYGKLGYGMEPGDIYIAFSANQIKDIHNENPTDDPDIRYSVTEDEVFDYLMDQNVDVSIDSIPLADAVAEEGRKRMAKSKAEFIQSKNLDWNERWLTYGRVLKTESVEKNIRNLIMAEMANSDASYKYKQELVDRTVLLSKSAFEKMKQGKQTEAMNILWDAATEMIENADFYDDTVFKQYKDLRDYLRTTSISLGEEYWSDVGYANFRRQNRGRIKLVKGETNIDKVYGDLQEHWGEWFDEESQSDPPAMLMRMAEVLDSIQPYKIAYTSEQARDLAADIADDLYNIIYEGEAYKSVADTYKEKYNEKTKALKQRHREALRDANKQIKKLQKRVEKEKDKQKEIAQKWKDKYQGRIKKEKERRKEKKTKEEHRKAFEGVMDEYNRLCKWVLEPTKDKNVPEEFRKSLAEFLQTMDLQTENSKKLEAKTGKVALKTFKLRELKDRLNDLAARKSDDGNGTSVFEVDAHVAFILEHLADKLEKNGNTIDALDVEDVKAIEQFMKLLVRNIVRYKEVKLETKMTELNVYSDKCMDFFLEQKMKKGLAKERGGLLGAFDAINATSLTPAYLFDRLGPMKEIYLALRHNGFDTYIRNENEIQEKLVKILGKYRKARIKGKPLPGSIIEEWRDDRSAQTFNLASGETVTLSVAQMMSLYCLTNRGVQALGHMLVGGIAVTPIQTGSKMEQLKERYKGKVQTTQKVVLEYEDILEIISKLTPDQKKVADELQRLMSKDMAALGNEAHRDLYGYNMFEEDLYFPIKVHGNARDTDINTIGEVVEKIKSFGFTKPLTPNANKAIVIDDIFSIVADHCNGMNLYNAYLVPITDFMKVLNYTRTDETGKPISMKDLIEDVYGKDTLKYIMNLMKDINGLKQDNRGGLEGVMNKALGTAKKTAVFGNVRVALQQPTAIVRALAEVDAKYFKPFLDVKPNVLNSKERKAIYEEMYKYCPIALWKSWGYYDTYMGRDIEDVMMNNWSMVDVALSGMYGALDNMTWSAIWQAVKAEQMDKYPDMDHNSEEFLKICGRRASEVFDKTQVVDSTFHRSDAMRNKQIAVKAFTAFMAEPTLTLNVFRAGLYNFREAWRSGNKAKAFKILSRALSVIIIQAVVVSAAQAFADAWRGKDPDWPWDDDEDDETKNGYWERWLHNFTMNVFDQLHLENNMYLVKDVTPYINYMISKGADHWGWNPTLRAIMGWDQDYLYSQNNLIFAAIENTANGVAQMFKKMEKGEDYDKDWYDIIQKIASGVGTFTGIPVGTLMRDFKPILESVLDITFASDSELAEKTGKKKKSDSGKKKKKDKESDEESAEETKPISENELAEERASKTEDIKEKYADLSGEEKNKKIWGSVTTFAKDQHNGKGLADLIADGDYSSIAQYREMYIEAGGSESYFDERVMAKTKTEFKKSLMYDPSTAERSNMKAMWRYMVKNGYTEEEISADILYKSDLAKDLKVAFRLGDESVIFDALVPLVDAGIVFNDIQRLWDNRNHMQLSSYNGRYKDLLKSQGNFIWPVNGTITSHFGARNAPTRGASSNHPAIDIAAPTGTPVSAADGGVVIYAGSNGGYGNSVGIKHDNGMVTYYNHLSGWNVKKGDTVAQGQQIGAVGSTGISTGPHLDFKVLDTNGKPVDPEQYLSKLG